MDLLLNKFISATFPSWQQVDAASDKKYCSGAPHHKAGPCASVINHHEPSAYKHPVQPLRSGSPGETSLLLVFACCWVITELVGGMRSFSSSLAALHAAPTPSLRRAHVCQCLGTPTPAAPNLWHWVHLSLHVATLGAWTATVVLKRGCRQNHVLQGQARLTTPSPSVSSQSMQYVCRVQGTAFSVDILGYLRPLVHTSMAPTKAYMLLDSRQPSPCIHKWVSVEIIPLMDLHRRFELL